MPGGDRTGPRGDGPMTGRAAGFCAGYPVPGYLNPVGLRGRGFGLGRRRGFGRGWGHGRRWIRQGYGYYNHPAFNDYGPNDFGVYPYEPELTPKQETEFLKQEAEMLKQELEEIQKRIEALGKTKKKTEKGK